VVLGLFVKDVEHSAAMDRVGLYGGYVAANVLKWHGGRFNASVISGVFAWQHHSPPFALAVTEIFGACTA